MRKWLNLALDLDCDRRHLVPHPVNTHSELCTVACKPSCVADLQEIDVQGDKRREGPRKDV